MLLSIDPCGTTQCLYTEEIDLYSLGRVSGRRASHVEMTDGGQHTADMSPSGGPVLGPFPLRSQALAAEVAWLEQHLLGGA